MQRDRKFRLSGAIVIAATACTMWILGGGGQSGVWAASTASGGLSASEILDRMAAARKGLNSYSVPMHFDLVVHKGIGVRAKLDGTRYFQTPDKEVLVMGSMPSIAKQFRYIYSGLGAPQTWPLHYDISLNQTSDSQYELKGVPKDNPNVSYVLLDVTRGALTPVSASWFYKNGGTVTMAFQNAPASGYVLPSVETIDINFPEYKVHAVGTYGSYSINQPIPNAIWNPSPQPLPT